VSALFPHALISTKVWSRGFERAIISGVPGKAGEQRQQTIIINGQK